MYKGTVRCHAQDIFTPLVWTCTLKHVSSCKEVRWSHLAGGSDRQFMTSWDSEARWLDGGGEMIIFEVDLWGGVRRVGRSDPVKWWGMTLRKLVRHFTRPWLLAKWNKWSREVVRHVTSQGGEAFHEALAACETSRPSKWSHEIVRHVTSQGGGVFCEALTTREMDQTFYFMWPGQILGL